MNRKLYSQMEKNLGENQDVWRPNDHSRAYLKALRKYNPLARPPRCASVGNLHQKNEQNPPNTSNFTEMKSNFRNQAFHSINNRELSTRSGLTATDQQRKAVAGGSNRKGYDSQRNKL